MSNSDLDGLCLGLFILGGLFLVLLSPLLSQKELVVSLVVLAVVCLVPIIALVMINNFLLGSIMQCCTV